MDFTFLISGLLGALVGYPLALALKASLRRITPGSSLTLWARVNAQPLAIAFLALIGAILFIGIANAVIPFIPALISGALAALAYAAPYIIAGIGLAAPVATAFSFATLAGYFALGVFSTIALSLLADKPAAPGGQAPTDRAGTIQGGIGAARYVLGEQALGGHFIFYGEEEARTTYSQQAGRDVYEHDAWAVFCISEGACEGLQKVWINTDEVDLVNNTPPGVDGYRLLKPGPPRALTQEEIDGGIIAPRDYRGKIEFYEVFDGLGNGLQPLIDAAASDKWVGPPWTADHRLRGRSYIAVRLIQPSYKGSDYAESPEARFWTGRPALRFLVKGMKLTWPGQAAPQWTRNAAAIRYWWLTARRGLPADLIPRADFDAAYQTCDEDVDRVLTQEQLDAGFEPRVKRYTIDGIVESGDDPVRVERDMDIAWAGVVLTADGYCRFRPGKLEPVVGHITEDQMLGPPTLTPVKPMQQRVNALKGRLGQSRQHQWLEAGVGEVIDEPAEARDGERRYRDLGIGPFVVDGLTWRRLMAIILRVARGEGYTFGCEVMPGDDFFNAKLIPGNRLLLSYEEYGLDRVKMVVMESEVDKHLKTKLLLGFSPDSTYDDSEGFPPLPSPDASFSNVALKPGLPTGVTSAAMASVSKTGEVVRTATISWDETDLNAEVRYRCGVVVSIDESTRHAADGPWGGRFSNTPPQISYERFDKVPVNPGDSFHIVGPEWGYVSFFNNEERRTSSIFLNGRPEGKQITAPASAVEVGVSVPVGGEVTITSGYVWQLVSTEANSVDLSIPNDGDWVFSVRLVNKDGVVGDWHNAGETIDVSGDLTPPIALPQFSAEPILLNIVIRGFAPPDRDIAGVEVFRTTYAAEVAAPNAPDNLNEVSFFTPAKPNEPFEGLINTAAETSTSSQKIRLWARAIDTTGNAGPLTAPVDIDSPHSLIDSLNTWGDEFLTRVRAIVGSPNSVDDTGNLLARAVDPGVIETGTNLGVVDFIYKGGAIEASLAVAVGIEILLNGSSGRIQSLSGNRSYHTGGGGTNPVKLDAENDNIGSVSLTLGLFVEGDNIATREVATITSIFGGVLETQQSRETYEVVHRPQSQDHRRVTIRTRTITRRTYRGPDGLVNLTIDPMRFEAATITGWGVNNNDEIRFRARIIRGDLPEPTANSIAVASSSIATRYGILNIEAV